MEGWRAESTAAAWGIQEGRQSGSGWITNIMAVNLAASRCTLLSSPPPPLPLLSSPSAANKLRQSSGDKIVSRIARGVWMQSLQVGTQLLNSQFSPVASGAFTLHTSANPTPGVRRHCCVQTGKLCTVSCCCKPCLDNCKGLRAYLRQEVCPQLYDDWEKASHDEGASVLIVLVARGHASGGQCGTHAIFS